MELTIGGFETVMCVRCGVRMLEHEEQAGQLCKPCAAEVDEARPVRQALAETWCGRCMSQRVDGYWRKDAPEVLHCVCSECGHEWEG